MVWKSNKLLMVLIAFLLGCATKTQVSAREQCCNEFMLAKGVNVKTLPRDNARWAPPECITIRGIKVYKTEPNLGSFEYKTDKSLPSEKRFRALVSILSSPAVAAEDAFSDHDTIMWLFIVAKTFEKFPFERLSEDSFILLNSGKTILVHKNLKIKVESTDDSREIAIALLEAGLVK